MCGGGRGAANIGTTGNTYLLLLLFLLHIYRHLHLKNKITNFMLRWLFCKVQSSAAIYFELIFCIITPSITFSGSHRTMDSKKDRK